MPGPSGKKRLGSRRKVATRVGMQDDLSAGDHSAVLHPQEIAQSFSDLSNEGQAHWVRSSEEKSSKLGSSRQSKRRDAELSSIEPGHKSTEEVEQIVSTEKLQTEMSPAAQAVRQKDFSELDDCESIHGTHLYSDFTPGHGFEPLSPTYLGAGVQIRPPECETLHLGRDDAESDCKQGVGLHDQSEFAMSAQYVLEDAENEDPLEPVEALQDEFSVESEEMDFLSSPERRPEKKSCRENVDISIVEQGNCSAIGEMPTNEEHEPFRCSQVRSAQVPGLVEIKEAVSSKSDQIDFTDFGTPEDKRDSLKRLGSFTIETGGTHEAELSVKTCADPQDIWEAQMLKEQTKGWNQKEYSQPPDTNGARVHVEKNDSAPFQENCIDDEVKAADGVSSTVLDGGLSPQSVQPESVVFESQTINNNASTDVKRNFFSPARNRRKLGSSRRNKGSHASIDAAEMCSDDDDLAKKSDHGDDPSRTKDAICTIEAAEKETAQLKGMDSCQTLPGEDVNDLVRHNISFNTTVPEMLTHHSSYQIIPEVGELALVDSKTKAGEEMETFLQHSQNASLDDSMSRLREGALVSTVTQATTTSESSLHKDAEMEYSAAVLTVSSPFPSTSTDKHENFSFSQVTVAQHPGKELIKEVQFLETGQIKPGEILSDKSSSGEVEKYVENLLSEIVETRMSDFSAKTFLDSRFNPQDNRDDHPMNQHTVEVSEQRHEKDYACNTTETWTNTEKTDHTQSQAQDTEAQAMSDAERSSKRVLSGTADSLQSLQSEPPEPSFAFDSQTECNTAGTDEQRDSLRSPIKVFASKEYGDFNEDATGSAGDDGDHPTEMELADMNKSRLPEMDNLDTFSGQYPDSVSTQHLKSLETGHGEDSGTLSPARNRRKLGSTERRNKGRYVKVFDPEVCNKSADESDGNSRDEKDYQETKDTTFREETAEVEITKINWLNKDTNIERGPTEAIMSPPQEEVEGQCEPFNISGGRRTENLENRVKKMFQEKVKPVEMAAGTAGQQASQEHMNPTPKAAEEIEVQLVHRLKTEEDSISPNSDRNEVAASQGEVPETLCNSNEHANVYCKSSMNVRDSEETLQVKDIDDVSFKERSLESVLQAKKGAQEEIGLSSQQMGLRNLSLTSTEKGEKSSARRPQIETKREAEMDDEDETRALKNVQVLEDPAQTGALHQGEPDLTGLESDPQLPDSSRRRNVIPAADDVGTVFSEQVSSRCAFLSASQVADVTGSDSEIPVAMGTFQPDYAPVSEDHVMSSADIESKRKQQMCSDKGGVDHESFSTVAAQVPSQERTGALPNTREIIRESDGEPDKNLKSPGVNLTNRKRKMGTTRRNLGTISKRDLEPKLDTSTEATLTAPERGRQGKEKETRPDSSGSEPTPETAGDPPSTAPAHQTAQENLTAESQPAGRDIPQKPSTVPRLDALSETEPGGGKRKLGSRRKSRVPQTRVDQSEADNAIRTQPETSTQQHAEDVLRGPEELQVTSAEKATPYRSPQGGLHLGQDILSFGESSSDLKAKRFNVVMIGDSYVGKTSFMKRAQNGKFFPDCAASAGLDTCLWTVIVDGKPVALQLWDTAGQERFRSITNQIYHRAHAFLLMYDITSSQSFAAVHYWARCIQEGAAENVPILLLGNKNDHTKRTVTTEEGQNVAKEFNVGFMECSAVTGDNVIQSLEAVARLLSQNDDGRQETPGLHKEPPKNKSGCC